jgi:hypothetical protein
MSHCQVDFTLCTPATYQKLVAMLYCKVDLHRCKPATYQKLVAMPYCKVDLHRCKPATSHCSLAVIISCKIFPFISNFQGIFPTIPTLCKKEPIIYNYSDFL